jgi:hypothetical protein
MGRLAAKAGKEAKRCERAKIGRLGHNVVSAGRMRSYAAAINAFRSWVVSENLEFAKDWYELDLQLGEYIEYLWCQGDGKAMGNNTMAAVHSFVPSAKGKVPMGWRLLQAWGRLELPDRAPPMPPVIVLGMAGFCKLIGRRDLMVALLVGFHCMLRTGEMLNLVRESFTFDPRKSRCVVDLQWTKTGKRKGGREIVTIDDPLIFKMVQHFVAKLSPMCPVIQCSANEFRRIFAVCLNFYGLSHLGFKPYSIRRGGATFEFQQSASLDKCCLRGRWQSARTARLYIMDGLSVLRDISLSNSQLNALQLAASTL